MWWYWVLELIYGGSDSDSGSDSDPPSARWIRYDVLEPEKKYICVIYIRQKKTLPTASPTNDHNTATATAGAAAC